MSAVVHTLGIDLGKNTFHLVGLDPRGKPVLRKKLSRRQLAEFMANLSPCLVAMESCPGSQYWGHRFVGFGHTVRLIAAQFVKPFLKSNKNDFNDAEAIAEAACRPTMRFVPLKSQEQRDLQAIHRIRQRLITERTALTNQIRAFLLEAGIAIPAGRRKLRDTLPNVLEDADNMLSPTLRELIADLIVRWRQLEQDIERCTLRLEQYARESDTCQRLITTPGIGALVATALVAAVGSGEQFANGRALAAWLGLVPRQYSTGGKARLGGISKRGNTHLRQMLVHGARSLQLHMKRDRHRLGQWLAELEGRTHKNVAIIALANKLARVAWKVLTSHESYRSMPLLAPAA
jgi:transposase